MVCVCVCVSVSVCVRARACVSVCMRPNCSTHQQAAPTVRLGQALLPRLHSSRAVIALEEHDWVRVTATRSSTCVTVQCQEPVVSTAPVTVSSIVPHYGVEHKCLAVMTTRD